ncbi:hypothetical protein PSYPI_13381 [Pseudomonas syringae pv. pisi str. 1704B]|uniref:Uncharacterized protein n=1 Tax=Pseudomonas syringae pv. pisi str. 1704B TaxID=629263 RepID=F3G8C2_PSESJ|nr:hypothetical protein PSYPI_13381 [Pseudomonas syringae pv. pisi str. 1704B]
MSTSCNAWRTIASSSALHGSSADSHGVAAQFDGIQYGHGVAGFSLLLDHRQQARHVPAAQRLKCLPAQADRAADRLLNAGQ